MAPPRHDHAERITVAHRLAQRDDVRKVTTTVKAPEMRAGPSQAVLHFITDDQAPCRVHRGHDRCHPIGRRVIDAVAGQGAVDHEGGKIKASLAERRDRALRLAADREREFRRTAPAEFGGARGR